MEVLINLFVSFVEWIAFITFPLILLGYTYKKQSRSIIILACSISLISELLHKTGLIIPIIVLTQIIIIFALIFLLFKIKLLESLVITSIGYGFFVFLQLIIVQFIIHIYSFQYLQLFFIFNLKISIQLTTALIVFLLSYVLYHHKYQLNDLRHNMQTSSISKKSRNILILNSIITFIFIYFVLSILAFEGFAYKYIISLIVTVILFIIVFIYFVLHSQFQAKRLVEEKKFYLDQEQQSALFIEKILNDYKGYFRAIVKLCEKDSPELIKRFVEKHYLSKGSSHSVIHSSHIKLAQVDELLYAFLINKQKIASLLGVSFIVTPDVNSKTSLSLRQVQLLSLIIDDLIFRQYQAASIEDKHINLTIRLTNDELNCDISSNLVIGEDENTNLKLLDALIQFERSNAVVNLNLKPIKIEIRSQLT